MVVLWVCGLLLAVGWWALSATRGTTSCELGQGTSVYGQPGWSWAPPGPTCTWTADQTGVVEITAGPGVAPALATVVLLGWPLLVAAGYRAGRRQGRLRAPGH